MRQKCVAEDFEDPRVGFTPGTVKGIDRLTNLEIHEPAILNQFLPACTRHATSDSSRPQVNVAGGRFGHRFAVGDIGKLQNATGFENT